MRDGFSFPPFGKSGWDEPATQPIALPPLDGTTFNLLTLHGRRSFEEQGLRVADTAELTRRVVSLERAHEHDADHMTATSLNVANVHDEVRIVFEAMRAEIDELRDQVRSLLLKVAA